MTRLEHTTTGEPRVPDADGDHVEQKPERIVAEAIHNTRRRYALYYLHKQDGPVALSELVRQVAAWENCCRPEEVPTPRRKSVYSSLHQTHLPYLEERGLVAFDRETNEIQCLLENSELELLLADDLHTKVRWYRVYLLLCGVGTVVLGGSWAVVRPFDLVSPLVLVGAVVGSFVVASVLHWYDVHTWRCRMDEMPPDFLVTIDRDGLDGATRNEKGT